MGEPPATTASPDVPVPVFFLSDSTGISAETMGNALLIQFPHLTFERRLIPFIGSVEEARQVVAILDEAMEGPVTPLVFSTAATEEIRLELGKARCPVIDFYEMHMSRVEQTLGVAAQHVPRRLHGVGDVQRYNSRMQAIEYSIQHDDGQTLRAIDRADVILIAPSRCGKTPTSMYLALQHGLFVANYPLVDEDLDGTELPRPCATSRTAASACSPPRRAWPRCASSAVRTPATRPSTSARSSCGGPRRCTAPTTCRSSTPPPGPWRRWPP